MGLFIALCAPAFAHETFYDSFYFHQVQNSLNKKVKTETEKAAWVQAVQEQAKKPASGRVFEITSTDKAANARVHALKALIKNNRALWTYTFVVPDASRLAGLNKNQFDFLVNFLRQPIEKDSFNVAYAPEVLHPQNGETQLTFQVEGAKLILLISHGATKKVYFFKDQVPHRKLAAAADQTTDSDSPTLLPQDVRSTGM